ncbi:hypothetical protein IMCC21906_01494 [Spongiibacter sp. IMCC21906]|jgi:hypothetical protein|uniref:hypothetical protein n=1 Tax=Spongiibacter sp. IMCC21906 TaxID=1620392 RepID=UPI00062DD64A|nr:hypothetical protein [Spongiibacter sp. IMCC21906]AKH69172.1 hypothetical protein IMCC21906_01494 [Spongiibacter sp. IMCC21906]
MIKLKVLATRLLLLCWGVALHAAETGPIRGEVGFVDEVSGARVEAVDPDENGEYRVLVSLPNTDTNKSPTIIEEIVVRAERDESVVDEPAPAAPRYEVIKDYANDRYGFYVYLGKNKSLPFRIFFKDHSAKEIHNR